LNFRGDEFAFEEFGVGIEFPSIQVKVFYDTFGSVCQRSETRLVLQVTVKKDIILGVDLIEQCSSEYSWACTSTFPAERHTRINFDDCSILVEIGIQAGNTCL
jgi:hypothetical protein